MQLNIYNPEAARLLANALAEGRHSRREREILWKALCVAVHGRASGSQNPINARLRKKLNGQD